MTEELYVILAIFTVLGIAFLVSKSRSKKSGPKVGGTGSKDEVK